MNSEPLFQSRFERLNCCVLIPTYNNAATLERVINEVLSYTSNLIVVNDGSTDSTSRILNTYTVPNVLTLPINGGKGNALKKGFKRAEELGYEYAITMDSDGQHFPSDLDVFLTALEHRKPEDPELLIIGARKMDDPSVPDSSSFGNKLSTFWFWVETGVDLTDTQCGYRLYPVSTINSLSLRTSKFELEIEIIVKAAWRGVEVKNLPVKVLYDPLERVTHFRPFQDVTRITLLNIWFVGLAACYIAPRNLLRRVGGKPRVPKKKVTGTDIPLNKDK